MAGDMEVKLVISGDGSVAVSSLKKVGDEAERLSSRAKSSFDQVMGHWKSLAAGIAAYKLFDWGKDLVSSTIEVASSFEKTQIMLDRLMGSASGGKEAFNWLLDLSTKVPIGIDALQDSFVKLKTAGMDPMSGSLQILTDAVAAFGGGSEELKRASVAIQQMAGKGVISMEELRQQLGEVLPTAMKLMAEQMGISIGELVDQVSKGNVSATEGLGALFKGLEKEYKGAAAGMMNSFSGLIASLSAEWKKFQNEIAESGAFDILKDSLRDLIEWMKKAKETGDLTQLAQNISNFFAGIIKGAELVGKVLYWVREVGGILTYGAVQWGVMGEAQKKYNKELLQSNKWIKENSEFLAERAKKHQKPLKTEEKVDTKEIERLKKLDEEWNKVRADLETDISGTNLDSFSRKILEIKNKAEDLKTKWKDVGDSIVTIEEWKASQIDRINRESFADQVKEYKDYADQIMTQEKKRNEEQVESLKTYRDSLLKVYDEAIQKAQAYGDQIKRIDDIVSSGKSFLRGLQEEKLSPEKRMAADRERLNELLKVPGSAGSGIQDYERALKGIEEFINKYKGTKSPVTGWDVSFSDLTHEYERLLDRLELMKPNLEASQNSWLAYADLAVSEIARIDQETLMLQETINQIDLSLSSVKELKIDTSNAQASLAFIIDQLRTIELSPVSMAPASGISGTTYSGVSSSSFYPGPGSEGGKVNVVAQAQGTPGGVNINLGGITVNGSENPEDLARKMVKPLQRELNRLSVLSR